MHRQTRQSDRQREKIVTAHRQAFAELKMPYDTVVAADFADLECEVRIPPGGLFHS